MDTGLLRRLANLCKDHYVLREIDDLFVYAGADHAWPTATTEPTHGSQRVQRFYEWVEGIKQRAPRQLDTILMKVAAEIAANEQVSERGRALINEALSTDEQAQTVESGIQLEPLLSTLARLLAGDGLAREVAIVVYATPKLEWRETASGHNGPVEIYRLYLQLPPRLYGQIESGRQTLYLSIEKGAI